MSFAKVSSAQTVLLEAHPIVVEADLSRGLHSFTVVGLPDKAVEESRDRVAAAIKNSGFTSPKSTNQKIVISLAPADIKKEGPLFDVPIALAYLLASGDITFPIEKKLFIGELSLDGKLRPVSGVLPITLQAKKEGFEEIYLPQENAPEATLVEGISVYGVSTLKALLLHLRGEKKLDPEKTRPLLKESPSTSIDFGDIKGQEGAKRGMMISAAGGHNIALFGPPGTGKTMLARALTSILPSLSFEETLEATAIHSVAGLLGDSPVIIAPPFRSPHHTSSYVALLGGGSMPKPGEATLAHRGVLFLDEFPEFDRRVIEGLREPLEERVITISRARGSARFPASFLLVASMNPCPCGNFGSSKPCICNPAALERYRRKVSGPIMDRIDMWIEVGEINYKLLREKNKQNVSADIKDRVKKAREIQEKRFGNSKSAVRRNSEMGVKDIESYIELRPELEEILEKAAARMHFSPRVYHKVLKLTRTIADLEESEEIKKEHLLEALAYRPRPIGIDL